MKLQGRYLKLEMCGEDVALLHKELQELGYAIPEYELIQSCFGKGTVAAVKKFQTKNEIKATGVVDAQTATAINQAVDLLEQHLVDGNVTLKQDGSAYTEGMAKGYDIDAFGEQLVFETIITPNGSYHGVFKPEQFTAGEKRGPDIIVRVFDPKGRPIGESEICFNAGKKVQIDVQVTLPKEPKLSEYEQVLLALAPLMEKHSSAELNSERINFLQKELADVAVVNVRRLNILNQGAQLVQATNLPTEFFYGVARQLNMSLPLNLDNFLALSSSGVRDAIEKAVKKAIIPAFPYSLDTLLARFEQLKLAYGKLVQQQLIGRLINEETRAPLADYIVRGVDLDADPAPKDLGADRTNNQGVFTLVYTARPQSDANEVVERNLRLHVLEAQRKEIYQVDLVVKAGVKEGWEIPVPVQALPQPPSHPLDELATTLKLNLPEGLLSFLAENNIHSLQDIRKNGGIRQLEGLPVPADDPAVPLLEAHANLITVSSDVNDNASLIERGFTHFQAIAALPRPSFVSAVYEALGDRKAARYWETSKAESGFLNNVLVGRLANFANGFSSSSSSFSSASRTLALTSSPLSDWFVRSCDCEDCQSGVSPLAYLADLLYYATNHLQQGSSPVTVDILANNLHQPFGDLPAACEQVEKRVRQVRICIEVLRQDLGTPSGAILQALQIAEKEYLLKAYTTLLYKARTSYDELRLLTSDAAQREALASRLGIRVSHLNDLRLVPGTAPTDPGMVTEAALQTIFGLRDTHRDPLTDPAEPQLLTWRLQILRERWLAEERDSEMPIIDPDLISKADLSNPIAGNFAFDFLQSRQQEIADDLAELTIQRSTGLDAVIRAVLSTNVSTIGIVELQRWRTDYQSGVDILPEITEQGLTFASFMRLLTFIDIGEARLSESEWEEIYAILITSWKRRLRYRTWRIDESGVQMTLSPEYFRLATTEPELIPWRATEEDRRAWQDKLRARIDQYNTVVQGINEMVDSTEEAVLEMLRDALITAIGELAKPLGQRLAIDCLNDACQKTTRVAQAMESLQTLFFAVRTGQRTDYTLEAPDFDEEWKWLGSYASWRSAMFVFMYPENVLYPSLRRWQTPALQNLISETRNNHRLTPEDACQAAREYENYFRDVSSLILEAAVQTRETSPKGDCRNRASRADRYPVYVFARGGTTNTVYYSSYDREDEGPYAQSFWKPVDGLENVQVLNIVGAAAYRITDDKRQIYLFLRVRQGLVQTLKYTTYDLQQGNWSGVINNLALPGDATDFMAVVKQRNRESEPPHLAIRSTDGSIYDRLMNQAGNAWDENEPRLLVHWKKGRSFSKLCAMIEPAADEFFIFASALSPDRVIHYRLFGDHDDGKWYPVPGDWMGGFPWLSSDRVYVFSADAAGTSYQFIQRSTASFGRVPIVDFNTFDDWLQNVAGISLSEYFIPYNARYPDFSGRNFLAYLNSLTSASGSSPYLFFPLHGFTDQIPNGEARKWDAWRFADQRVQDLIIDDRNAPTTLHFAIYALINRVLHGGPSFFIQALKRNTSNELSTLPPWLSGDVVFVVYGSGSVPTVHAGHIARFSVFALLFPSLFPASSSVGSYRSIFSQEADGSLSESTPIRIAPRGVGPFEITESLSQEQLQIRREAIRIMFLSNAGAPASVQAYLEEPWYLVPVHLALELQRRRQFVPALDWLRSVYDFRQPVEDDRRIYYGLTVNAAVATDFARYDNWLLDPLNPHAIAETRASTYVRFTLLSIIRCMLEFADVEFTRDDAESVPRARLLYETALELLDHSTLNQELSPCDDESTGTAMHALASREMAQATPAVITASSESGVIPASWQEHFDLLRRRALLLGDVASVCALLAEVEEIISSEDSIETRYATARDRIEKAIDSRPAPPTFATIVGRRPEKLQEAYAGLLTEENVAQATERSGVFAAQGFDRTLTRMLNLSSNPNAKELPWLRGTSGAGLARDSYRLIPGLVPVPMDTGDLLPASRSDFIRNMIDNNPDFIFPGWRDRPPLYTPIPFDEFCIPPNPIIKALKLYAELNLQKLRTCRNIAGLERQLEPYAAPTDTISGLPILSAGGQLVAATAIPPPPTMYRPEHLMARAKELNDSAAQMEAYFLSSLEKRDAEYMQLMKARQEVQLARAGVRLQNLHMKEANDNVRVAELTRNRARIELEHFQGLIDEGLLWQEIASLTFLGVSAAVSFAQSIWEFALDSTNMSSAAQGYATTASLLSGWASYERMQQDWQLRRNLASQDVQIGNQQITLAEDRIDIVRQERTISQMQTSFAEEIAEFLTNKFTSVELYEWMSQVLEGVYNFFLQQAAAVAKLAELQLAFERQEPPSGLIQADYWEAPSSDAIPEVTTGNAPNRRGLTGSARLKQDIASLEQYKFDTEKRKLQLTKTISLARLSPVEFQQFRENGVLHFHTPLELFDQDFPGHYLRLIKRVRVSVIALIPPTDGIHATFTAGGVSKVVIESNKIFHKINIQRESESIALSSPQNATGLFELQQEPEKLFPFEGTGVETFWELRMPKAANRFDFNTIFDVLFTIDYTALNDFDYQQQVISTQNRRISADRPFSFRHQFADQWFDLNNPDRTATPMTVSFTTRREDFPPNIENLSIQQVKLYFVRKAGSSFEVPINYFYFTPEETGVRIEGSSVETRNGLVSTLAGSAPTTWIDMIGKSPFGKWDLSVLSSDPAIDRQVRDRFKNEEIEDILFVITCGGETPAWPA